MTADVLLYHLQQHIAKRGTKSSVEHAKRVIEELQKNIQQDKQKKLKL